MTTTTTTTYVTPCTWSTEAIDAMSDEDRVRNFAAQLVQEAVGWGRAFSYRGQPVRRNSRWWKHWGSAISRVSLLCGGGRGRAWVQVEIDHEPMSECIVVKIDSAEAIHQAIVEAESSVAQGTIS